MPQYFILQRVVLAMLCIACGVSQLIAQANLSLTLSTPPGPHKTQQSFEVLVQYSCASTVAGAPNARIEIDLEPGMVYVSHRNSPHVAASGYDEATNTVWYEFVEPLPSGASGELGFRASFPGGVTANGASTTFTARFTADNATTQTATSTTTAESTLSISVEKRGVQQAQVGGNMLYTIKVYNARKPESSAGKQHLYNTIVKDTLPPGVEFLKFKPNANVIEDYDVTNRVVTWDLETLKVGSCINLGFAVKFSSSSFSLTEAVTNKVFVYGNPPGGANQTYQATEVVILEPAKALTKAFKVIDNRDKIAGEYGTYRMSVRSLGGLPIPNYQLIDTIPYAAEVTSISLGQCNDLLSTGGDDYITLEYQTNVDSSWQIALENQNESANPTVSIADLGLTLGGNEYITILRFSYGDRSAVVNCFDAIELSYRVRRTTPTSIIWNCASTASSDPSVQLTRECVRMDVQELPPNSSQYCYLDFDDCNNAFAIDDTVSVKGIVSALESGSIGIREPILHLVIPNGIDYVANSLQVDGPTMGAPVITYEADYIPGFYKLTASYAGMGRTLEVSESIAFNLQTTINAELPAKYAAGFIKFYVISPDPYSLATPVFADEFDVDGDSDSTNLLCAASIRIDVNERVALESNLGVFGSFDTEYTKFPQVGQTYPGGLADYRLSLVNIGNVPLSDFLVIDQLPTKNDIGVVDTSPRNSEWSPLLIGPVLAPEGITVSYSIEPNPCRAADGLVTTDPPGCQTPNWTIVPPDDITSVKSLRFDFNDIVLDPGAELSFTWPMRTPTDVFAVASVVAGDRAWNSFGYVATNQNSGESLLPSEPEKSGLEMGALVPGVVGDRVWQDANGNGVQEAGETGLNGVRVELYQDNGDGIANCADDTFSQFTVTTGDGNYLFSNITPGDYFVLIEKPATLDFSPLGAGSSDVDNDFSLATCKGWAVGVSPIVSVDGTVFDYDVDAGVVPNGMAAIGDYVWLDLNANGLQDEGAARGLDGIQVDLFNSAGNLLASTTTATGLNGLSGKYQFSGLTPASYAVGVSVPAAVQLSPLQAGSETKADSDADPATARSAQFVVGAGESNASIDIGLLQSPFEVCANGIDDDGDGQIDNCASLTGYVFEDINYGGGAGRSYSVANAAAVASSWADSTVGVALATVELYSAAGDFITSTQTGPNGKYVLDNLMIGDHIIRVVSSSIASNRTSNSASLPILPVVTYRRAGSTTVINEVGGRTPHRQDAPVNTGSQPWAALTTPTTAPHAYTDVTIGVTQVTNINFGYSFSVISNTNDAGQGSLRQFVLNTNELSNANLDLVDHPASRSDLAKPTGWDVSIFEIPGGGPHTIVSLSALPALEDEQTHVSGYTQNGSSLGSIPTRNLNVQLTGDAGSFAGLTLSANNLAVSGMSITGFNEGLNAVTPGVSNLHIWGNSIGVLPDGVTALSNLTGGIMFAGLSNSQIGTNGDGVNDAQEGNLISGNYQGVSLRNSADLLIAGNFVGTDFTGAQALRNRFYGILIRDCSVQNVIGFDDRLATLELDAARNIISGNGTDGVRYLASNDQILAGNYIGTTLDGSTAMPNTGYGVQIMDVTSNTIVGTHSNGNRDVSERNIISGNSGGLRVPVGASGTNNRISGNYVGLDPTGTQSVPNSNNGLHISGNPVDLIIGTNGDGVRDVIERNIISGNTEDGIRISGGDNVTIAGNYIGTSADGTTAIGNGKRGILVDDNPTGLTIGYLPTMTNKNAAEVGNRIRYNNDAGIGHPGTAQDVSMRRNSYGYNASLAIDLDYDSVTPNDPNDSDSGPNGLLNYPVLTKVVRINGVLHVEGFARPGTIVELYTGDGQDNPSPLPPTFTTSLGEGATYLASAVEGSPADANAGTGTYVNDGTGASTSKTEARFEFAIPTTDFDGLLSIGLDITGIAIDPSTGATSEFSGITVLQLTEDCSNGIDDDGDGLADCDDQDCQKADPVVRVTRG